MEIRINNQLAALKKGTSFEYVSENRLFTGSDGYTLTITFPLKGCPQNLAIFGHINRADVATRKVIFDCEIRDRGFYKFVSITITEISATEVKTQFLEGRSEQNFSKTFDKVYINELDLGTPPTTSKAAIVPPDAWNPDGNGCKYVALPWVNDYSGNIQNCADPISSYPFYQWSNNTTGLSWQPYLWYITKKICEAIGYTTDFIAWEATEEYRYLLICNTLPFAWYMPEFARALPRWTVEEYFEKLSVFLGGEFDFDHRAKKITFAFTNALLRKKEPVLLEKVIEEHSTEVKVEEEDCNYLGSKNLAYKDCDHRMWKFYSCDWFIKGWQNNIMRYDHMRDLLADNKQYYQWSGSHGRNYRIDKVLYAKDADAYFIVYPVSRKLTGAHRRGGKTVLDFTYTCRLQPINLFGSRINNPDEDASVEEIEFVPAWIDDTDEKHGRALFLSFSSMDDDSTDGEDEGKYPFAKPFSLSTLEAGEKTKSSEYYDRIYVAWYDGAGDSYEWGKLAHPYVENIVVTPDWENYRYAHFSMRINTKSFHTGVDVKYKIEPKMKITFKFLSDTIPDVRSLFIIRGKRYICEKLTATFTEQGMSQLIKGIFYPVVD